MSTLPLIRTVSMDSVIAREKGHPVSVRKFLGDVFALAEELPERQQMLNLCDRGYQFLVGFCAALVTGKTNILPPNRAPDTVKNVAAQFEDIFCLSGGQTGEEGLETVIFPSHTSREETQNSIPEIPASHIAAIAFTSGSAGTPRPHHKTWESMVTIARHTGERLLGERLIQEIEGPFNIVATVPPQHMYGLETAIMLPLQYGCALYSGRPFFPEDIREALESVPEERVWVATPLQIKACVAESVCLPRLSRIISATTRLPEELARRAEEKFDTKVFEIYGCTEAGSIATRRTVNDEPWQTLNEIELEGKDDRCFVKAPYLNQPVLLQDIINNIDNRRFTLHGRTGDLVNIEGKRASLDDLNHCLNKIDGVADGVFFIPQEKDEDIKRLVAFVVAPDLRPNDIIAKLRVNVDAAFLPRPLYLVEKLPRADSGKIPRERLRELYEQRSNFSADCISS